MLEFEQQVMSRFGVVEFQNQNVMSQQELVVCVQEKCHRVKISRFFGTEMVSTWFYI